MTRLALAILFFGSFVGIIVISFALGVNGVFPFLAVVMVVAGVLLAATKPEGRS